MAKGMTEVLQIVLDYGDNQRDKWFAHPNGDPDALFNPAISALSPDDFGQFFVDFTYYIRVENNMPTVIMTRDGLVACIRWADLAGYVFFLQQ